MPKKYKTKARKVSKQLKETVKKIVQGKVETKIFDSFTGSSTAPSIISTNGTSGTVYILSNVGQGVDQDDRLGDKISPLSLRVKGTLRHYSSVPTNLVYVGNPVRITIFAVDLQYTNAGGLPVNPTLNIDLFPPLAGGTTDVINRMPTRINKNVYTILYDRTHVPEYGAGQGIYIPFDITIKKRLPKVITFNGGASTVSSSAKNALFIAFSTLYDTVTGGVGGANAFVEEYHCSRLTYKDA